MKSLKSGLFLFLCFLLTFALSLFCCEAGPTKNCDNQKFKQQIRASMDEIIINESGIFLLVDDEIIPFEALHVDKDGFYFNSIEAFGRDRNCLNGHQIWCQLCRGCGVFWCPRSCKCNRD